MLIRTVTTVSYTHLDVYKRQDDLIATGGTTEAIIKLVEELGGEVVKVLFLMELEGLKGRDKIAGYDVESVIKYPGK